jgi:hypothetical protein
MKTLRLLGQQYTKSASESPSRPKSSFVTQRNYLYPATIHTGKPSDYSQRHETNYCYGRGEEVQKIQRWLRLLHITIDDMGAGRNHCGNGTLPKIDTLGAEQVCTGVNACKQEFMHQRCILRRYENHDREQ